MLPGKQSKKKLLFVFLTNMLTTTKNTLINKVLQLEEYIKDHSHELDKKTLESVKRLVNSLLIQITRV